MSGFDIIDDRNDEITNTINNTTTNISNSSYFNEENDNNLSSTHQILEIRDLLTEITHQITHLDRSITELNSALVDCPDDMDFIQAIQENQVLIHKKIGKVVELRDFLLKHDPAYRAEAYSNLMIIQQRHVTNTNTSVFQTTDTIARSSEHIEVASDNGLYL